LPETRWNVSSGSESRSPRPSLKKRVRQQCLYQPDPLVFFLFHIASKTTLSALMSVANMTSVDYNYAVIAQSGKQDQGVVVEYF